MGWELSFLSASGSTAWKTGYERLGKHLSMRINGKTPQVQHSKGGNDKADLRDFARDWNLFLPLVGLFWQQPQLRESTEAGKSNWEL